MQQLSLLDFVVDKNKPKNVFVLVLTFDIPCFSESLINFDLCNLPFDNFIILSRNS